MNITQLEHKTREELLVNKFIHTATGINEAGGDDGQTTTLVGIAGGTEEALGRMKRSRVNTTG